MSPHRLHLPFSTRHAFALAFDLATRRDPLHSFVVPFLLRAPWFLALVAMPPLAGSEYPGRVLLLSSVALLGQSVSWLGVDAMLRFRARSVFNTPAGRPPAPVLECYARGLRRLPWLYVTEAVRGVGLAFGFSFLVLPGVFLGYRLAFSTESVVLDEKGLAGAFQRSFRLSQGRFERWLEMIVVSVLLVLGLYFVSTATYLIVGRWSFTTWVVAGSMLVLAFLPVIQYAWTFFYLRLVEVEMPAMEEVGPLYAGHAAAPARPGLSLVQREDPTEPGTGRTA